MTDRHRSQSVASLSHTLGRDVHRYDLLPLLVEAILSAVDEAASDHENLIDDFRQRCLLTGQEIEYQDGLKRETGTCLGVASDGALSSSWFARCYRDLFRRSKSRAIFRALIF